MMRSPIRFALLFAASALVMVACDSPTSTREPSIGAPSRTITPAADLGAEIRSLVTNGYPKGQATAILAKWDQVLKAIAKEPKRVLKGHAVPGDAGRAELARTVAFMELKMSDATPPAGETKAHFTARIVLDMSLYVYGGPSTPTPSFTPTSDVAFALVDPATTDTVVTPAKLAAVIFPAGAVSEPTVVVVTPDTTYYPNNCSGPLDTHLCQYPRFYHFNVFPDVKLNAPAKVQVCHVDAGAYRRPLADHDRFRVAHEKPASSADYSTGSTIVDNVEILQLVTMNVTTCTADGGTTYIPSFSSNTITGRWSALAQRLASGVSAVARTLFVPKDAMAIDVGGGGSVEEFSMFGVVDPDSKPDLAQSPSPSSRFQVPTVSLAPAASLALPGWSVTNLGSGTSAAFTSKLVIANDSALSSVVSSTSLSGAASLVPGASFGYAATTLTAPATPGTYFVGTKLVYAGTDSIASDDWTSVRISVVAPTVNHYSLFSQGTYASATGGGAGGGPYTIACPARNVAIGMSGATGSYYGWASIYRLQLQCAELFDDGSLGEASTTAFAGLFTGGAQFQGTCANAQMLTGASGAHTNSGSNDFVSTLSGACASPATVLALGGAQSSIGPWSGSGSGANTPFAVACNPGSVVTGIQASAGDVLDGIGFLCTPVVQPVFIP